MNQAEVSKLMSQLRIAVRPNKRHLKNPDGPEGRLLKLRKTITALVKHERIELFYNRADEARGYVELVNKFILPYNKYCYYSPYCSSFRTPYAMEIATGLPWSWLTTGCSRNN